MRPDVNKPVENPKLSALLRQFNEAEETEVEAIYESIAEELAMNAYLLAVVAMDDNDLEQKGDGTVEFKNESSISLAMFENNEGVTFLPVYTDWDEIRKFEGYRNDDVKTIILSFDDMQSFTAGTRGIVINPFSDNFIIGPENVVHIKQHKDMITDGISEETTAENTRIMLGEPADYPTGLVEAVKKYARKKKAIKAIWLKLMIRGDEQSLLLIVDCDGNVNSLFKGIAKAARPHLNNGLAMDMIPLDDDFGRQAAQGDPFYIR